MKYLIRPNLLAVIAQLAKELDQPRLLAFSSLPPIPSLGCSCGIFAKCAASRKS